MATLFYRSPNGPYRIRVLDPTETMRLGRDPGNHLVFNHPTVSRQHALISFSDGRFFLEDLGSRNRVFINGKPLAGRVPLREGDSIVLGFDQENAVRFSESNSGPPQEIVDLSSFSMGGPFRIKPFQILLQISEAMTVSRSMEEVFELVLSGVLEISVGSRAMILLKRDDGEIEVVYRRNSEEADPLPDHVFSRSAIQRVAEAHRPFLIHNAAADPSVGSTDSVVALDLHTIVAVPLLYSENNISRQRLKDPLMGILYVDGQSARSRFSDEDIELLLAFSRQAAIAIENAKLHLELRDNYVAVVTALAAAVEVKDRYTRGHSELVSSYACVLAEKIQLSEAEIENIVQGGILHDVGKIGIPEEILNKPGRLTAEEFEQVKRHPLFGEQILRPVTSLAGILEMVRYHHERLDGTGYPYGLEADAIGLDVRLIAVADVFEALTAHRSYRPAMEPQKAIGILEREAGPKLDAELVEIMLKVYHEAGFRRELIRPRLEPRLFHPRNRYPMLD